MNTTMTIDAAEYMEPIEGEPDELDDDVLGMMIVLDLFERMFKEHGSDADVQQDVERYKALSVERFQCEPTSPMAFLFTGFAFGVGEGLKLASEIKNM